MALIIDDELDICLMLTKHLEKMNFTTQYALTIKDARVKVLSPLYDVIFIDLTLPDGSGYDIIALIKELKLKSKIIVISAYDNESAKAIEAGADIFINKPFTTKTINDALLSLHLYQS